MARLPVPGSDKNVWGDVLNEFLGVEHNSDGTLKKAGDITQAQADAAAALAATQNLPKIFVQNTDPGGSASDGDIWIDTSL